MQTVFMMLGRVGVDVSVKVLTLTFVLWQLDVHILAVFMMRRRLLDKDFVSSFDNITTDALM